MTVAAPMLLAQLLRHVSSQLTSIQAEAIYHE